VKVDTGMSRLGLAVGELPAALAVFGRRPSLRLGGLCTHFASADLPERAVTDEALARFEPCVAEARSRGFDGLVNHAANSAAAVRFEAARLDAVRPGLALYGAMPSRYVALAGLEPVMRLRTRIMAVHEIAAGTRVSYGGLWRAPRASRIATLPLGYADGYPRHVTGASVLVAGGRVPVVGAVCMDMLMIDVTDLPATLAGPGTEVTLLGRDEGEHISVDDLAGWAGTVNYEILCGISKRVPRLLRDGAVTADGAPPAGFAGPGPAATP
jgi:alanine racemase